MKESLRRTVLFAVIVITGSVMILLDIPLLLLVPLILATGFSVLFLLGAVTVSDVRSALRRKGTPEGTAAKKGKEPKKEGKDPKKETQGQKISLIGKLQGMKFFEKKTEAEAGTAASPAGTSKNSAGEETPSHLRAFLSSIRSLGPVMKERGRQQKKAEHIDQLLDKTVSEKVRGSALAGAGSVAEAGGGGAPDTENSADPFMSLSDDEFDTSLLDGLGDGGGTASAPDGGIPGGISGGEGGGPALSIPEPEIPLPSLDSPPGDTGLPAMDDGGLAEFSGLEGGESIDKDFADLESLDLGDADLDVGEADGAPDGSGTPPVAGSGGSTPPPPGEPKPGWVKSDAPKGADIIENQVSTHADMAAFAGGVSGTDEDLLSSLSSDVKRVKKEQNLSLLRELKDFRAPAADIEKELLEADEWLKAPRRGRVRPPATGTKAAGGKETRYGKDHKERRTSGP